MKGSTIGRCVNLAYIFWFYHSLYEVMSKKRGGRFKTLQFNRLVDLLATAKRRGRHLITRGLDQECVDN